MNNLEERQARYLKDSVQIRLGGLAANLSRIGSFARNFANKDAVNSLLEESKYFIEWTAAETGAVKATELIELQITLARWQVNWDGIWSDEATRLQIGTKAQELSKRVLISAGLLESK